MPTGGFMYVLLSPGQSELACICLVFVFLMYTFSIYLVDLSFELTSSTSGR